MNKRTANRLSRQIESDAPTCQVTGMRAYERGSYALDVVDTKTGDRFVVNSVEQWTARMDEPDYSEIE